YVTNLFDTTSWSSGTRTKFISSNNSSTRCDAPTSELICAIMASEFGSVGRLEMHSFHGLVTGKTCIAERTVSAAFVLNKIAFVTTGRVPKIRPSWLMRSADDGSAESSRSNTTKFRRRFTTYLGFCYGGNNSRNGANKH